MRTVTGNPKPMLSQTQKTYGFCRQKIQDQSKLICGDGKSVQRLLMVNGGGGLPGKGWIFFIEKNLHLNWVLMKFYTKNLRISLCVDFTSTLLRGPSALKFHQQRALRAHQTRGGPQILWDAHQIYAGLIILQGEPRCSAMAFTPPPSSIPHLSHLGLHGLVHFTWPHAALGLISRA